VQNPNGSLLIPEVIQDVIEKINLPIARGQNDRAQELYRKIKRKKQLKEVK
jgi:hypothetical protein